VSCSECERRRKQKSEWQARWRKKKKHVDSTVDSTVVSTPTKNGKNQPFDYQVHIDRWNLEICQALGGVPEVQAMSDKRKAQLRNRLQELPGLWDAIIAEAKHLSRWAKERKILKFDFLMSQSGLIKFIEGNFREEK
jgi:hypothetical protein